MARGGARPGAGRKKGSMSKFSRIAMMQRMQETQLNNPGELPHEFLLRVSRGEKILHGFKTIKIGKGKNAKEKTVPDYIVPSFDVRVEAAAKAAPYFAPRLSAVEVTRNLTDDQLNKLIEQFAPQAGFVIDVGGTSTPLAGTTESTERSTVPATRPKLLARSPD